MGEHLNAEWKTGWVTEDELPPIELTESIRRKISKFMSQFHVGRAEATRVPRFLPSDLDRICDKFGYMDCNRIGRRRIRV